MIDTITSSYTNVNDDEMFDAHLEDFFSRDNFYANPMSTKIYLTFGGDRNDTVEIVGNAVVANLEEVNEKIPVYSYNSSTYQKYLQGKRIITGVIALRKVTIASFLNLIKKQTDKNDFVKAEAELLLQISELKKIQDNPPKGLIYMLESKLKKLKKTYTNVSSIDEFYINPQGSIASAENGELLETDNLLYYIEIAKKHNMLGGNTAKFRIEFKGIFDKGPVTNINDILFVKKQTEINIDKTDIFEVYSFIGNPSLKFMDGKDKENSSDSININIDDAKKLHDYEIS